MKKIILKVNGMSCSACSNHVEKFLQKQEGILDASVNLVLGQALIHYEDTISLETLIDYISRSGYQYGGVYDEKEENKKDNTPYYLVFLGILLLFIMYLSMGHMLSLPVIPFLDMEKYPLRYAITLCFLTIPYLVFGKNILLNGLKNLKKRHPNMDTLVSLGVLTSFLYSLVNLLLLFKGDTNASMHLYFESVCMIVFFIGLGRTIDKNRKEKTKEAIKELVKVTPESALIVTKGGEKEVTIDLVNVGDILLVKPGMKVAVDGTITQGSAHFDESFITGESTPVKKKVGDKVVAGAINYDGVVFYQAEKIGPKSTISQMVHLVLEASNSKMPISRVADKVSSIFVPFILILASLVFVIYLLLGFEISTALIHFVTVLVVACPCALGLATPLAIVVSIGSLAKKGILVKTSETLEIASHIDTILFDKTGTLTYGKLKVSTIKNSSTYTDSELLNLVANIEKFSTHPIAKAFQNYYQKELKVEHYKEQSGKGVTAKIKNKTYCLGNRKMVSGNIEKYQQDEEKMTKEGNSILYVVEENTIIGLIGVKDVVRESAKETIKRLKEGGYEVIMLTGDNKNTATQIGKELGISNIEADLLPSDKTSFIKKLQQEGKKVMMVGDGINDAPSLTTADIGLSFKGSTDIATNSSSVILTKDNLLLLLSFLKTGKKTLINIKENLFWAFFYNLLMIPIAMGLFENKGISINPMIASGAMMLSSLCVVCNALRLRNVAKKEK